MDIHECPYRIKSVRRKKRLVKLDFDKNLIRLSKRRNQLWQLKRDLPMVPLEHPYQRGWKRLFVLRDDLRDTPKAEFYEEILKKINTVHYHYDPSFKFKKRRKRRYGYEMRKQELSEIDQYHWDSNRLKLFDSEKECFTRVEYTNMTHRHLEVKYVFSEPWRFVLKVMPYMVTQVKQHDYVLEREIAELDNYIDDNFLDPRIRRLTNGSRFRYRRDYVELHKYINKLKNTPRYSQIEAYLDLET